jgi:hypothetical protein
LVDVSASNSLLRLMEPMSSHESPVAPVPPRLPAQPPSFPAALPHHGEKRPFFRPRPGDKVTARVRLNNSLDIYFNGVKRSLQEIAKTIRKKEAA